MKTILIVGLFLAFVPFVLTQNTECSIIIPANPLSAVGLATPYLLVATDPANGPCNQNNPAQAAFVQGAVLNTDTGEISIYNPLVIDKGTQALVDPVLPILPTNSVVGIWFGTNAAALTLDDGGNGGLRKGNCVKGITGSIFGQFAYCNAPAWFGAANAALDKGLINIPPLGFANDGYMCPTSRDFFVVDQDQSDNVVTSYLVTPNGNVIQNTVTNNQTYPGSIVLSNGSDEGLIVAMDRALGCTAWTLPDLADPNGNHLSSLPTNELRAAAYQPNPVALVPALDPMVLDNNGNINVTKLNAYRMGVNQYSVFQPCEADTTTYCRRIGRIFPLRAMQPTTISLLSAAPSPDPGAGNNLFTFLAQRFAASWTNLNCNGLLNRQPAITLQVDGNAVTIAASIVPTLIQAKIPGDGDLMLPPNSTTSSRKTIIGMSVAAFSTVLVLFVLLIAAIVVLAFLLKKKSSYAVSSYQKHQTETSNNVHLTSMPSHNNTSGSKHTTSNSYTEAPMSGSNPMFFGGGGYKPKGEQSYSIGSVCLAICSQDGQYYRAKIIDVQGGGTSYYVSFLDFPQKEWVLREALRVSLV